MKGGKGGRPRKPTAGPAARQEGTRGKPAKKGSAAKAPPDGPPKKGSRKKPDFGGSSSAGEE
jgi:hypothetical protein